MPEHASILKSSSCAYICMAAWTEAWLVPRESMHTSAWHTNCDAKSLSHHQPSMTCRWQQRRTHQQPHTHPPRHPLPRPFSTTSIWTQQLQGLTAAQPARQLPQHPKAQMQMLSRACSTGLQLRPGRTRITTMLTQPLPSLLQLET